MRSIVGIGPVITAGFLAHIDIAKAPTVGHIWRFCGLDPTVRWDKGTKRPWNASLKRLCWIVGESFTKVSNHPDDTYGKLYQQRKEREIARNEAGDYAEQAAASLTAKRFGDDTAAKKHYLAGKLPPARIHLRAQRWAVKIFLSHFHEVLFFVTYGERPPKPYVLDHVGGHVHRIEVPNRILCRAEAVNSESTKRSERAVAIRAVVRSEPSLGSAERTSEPSRWRVPNRPSEPRSLKCRWRASRDLESTRGLSEPRLRECLVR